MKNSDSNVYLYAKGWYKTSDSIEDLKIIYGLRNGMEAEYINIRNIMDCLITLTWEHMRKDNYGLIEFISDISPYAFRRRFYHDEVYEFNKAVIEKCLSILSLVKVSDIPEGLDEADEKVLPLSEYAENYKTKESLI
jgi:hypothetical protein